MNTLGRIGSAAEAEHDRRLFPSCDVIGVEVYRDTPREPEKKYRMRVI